MKKTNYPTEVLEVTIQEIDYTGHGIVRYTHAPDRGSNGKKLTLYIPNTVPGDIVKVTVDNAKGRRKARVNYDELLKAGASRNLTIPTHRSVSGGTPLQYMHYSAQLDHKENLVKKYLSEAGFDASLVQPIIGMENPNRYRNKMELTFGPDGELGMHEQGNYLSIIDMEDSIIATEVMVEIKHIISQWQKDHRLEGYSKESHSGLLRKMMMRQSFATKELMVALFVTEAPDKHQAVIKDLVERLNSQFEDLTSVMWVENTDIADQIIVDKRHCVYGRDFIYDELGGFRYRIWFDTFFQPNPVQAEMMVEYALALAEVDTDMRVLDLFCGVGTFSLPFAKESKELAGIEIVETSIESAKRNARDNGIDNTYFLARDARKGLVELQETWGQPDLLLLDPPRGGAGGKVMRAIGRLGTDKVVYVSCNPKTLAEDLEWLKDYGYELQTVQPYDQFPHTVHVECVVLMEKK